MQTFHSKIDWWVWGFVISMTGLLGQLLLNMLAKGTLQANLLFAVTYAFTIALLWWPLLSTRYQVDEQALTVKSMFLRWRIPLHSIQQLQAADYSDLAPALSFKRLRVDYLENGQPKFILLSPRDQTAFKNAVQGKAAQTEQQAG